MSETSIDRNVVGGAWRNDPTCGFVLVFNRWDPLIKTTCLVTRRVNTAAGDDGDDDVLGFLPRVDDIVDDLSVAASFFFRAIDTLQHG